MAKRNERDEGLIYFQSLLLFLFGAAGMMASSTLNAAMNAFTNDSNAVAFITDNEVITDTGSIPVQEAESVVRNFEMVCAVAMVAAICISVASVIRYFRK